MIACYDLGKSPATHDAVNWLVRVEKARIAAGEQSVEIVIKPGNRQHTARDMLYTAERKMWRAFNLLLPLTRCLPSCSRAYIGGGDQEHAYVNFKTPQRPVLKAPAEARRIVADFLRGIPNPVSITLRQADFDTERNSNVKEWRQVADWLQRQSFRVIYVPDAEALMGGGAAPMPGTAAEAASLMPELLLALYERCKMNLMTNQGRMVFALMSDAPVMAFNMLIPTLQCCSEPHLRMSAMTEDDDWGPRKRLFWCPDRAENIIPEVEAMLKEVVYA